MNKQFVVAGSYEEFQDYCRKKGMEESSFQYVDNSMQLMGIQNANVRATGNYLKNHAFQKWMGVLNFIEDYPMGKNNLAGFVSSKEIEEPTINQYYTFLPSWTLSRATEYIR